MIDRKIDGKTKLICLLGSPVDHSQSPALQNAAFVAGGQNYLYMAFDVTEETLGAAVAGLKTLGARGWGLTMPVKTAMLDYLDEIDPVAQVVGAVNTVVNDGGRLTGYTTDGLGFVRSLEREGVGVAGQKIILVGAGGAARAIAVQCAADGAREIVILNRTLDKAVTIAEAIEGAYETKVFPLPLDQEMLAVQIANGGILVNCTNIGMGEGNTDSIIEDPVILPAELVVADAVYLPRETALIRQAKGAGCKVVPGWGMLIYQGVAGYKHWTGEDMPESVVEEMLAK